MGRQDMMGQPGHDTGLPADKSYLECGLPDFLRESIAQMQAAWDRLDRGEKDLRWDCDYCNLQADINNAEVNQVISSEQAWYLRENKVNKDKRGAAVLSRNIRKTPDITQSYRTAGRNQDKSKPGGKTFSIVHLQLSWNLKKYD